MFINNGTWNDIQILQPETVELMSTIQPGLEKEGQAIIWYYKNQHSRRLLGHSGGDYGAANDMFFNPQVSCIKLYCIISLYSFYEHRLKLVSLF